MESPRANDTPLGVNRIAPQYEGEEAASDDWVITKISKVEKERSTETSDTDVSGSSSDGNAILVETVVSSDSESDIEDMGKQAFYSEMSRYGQPEISPGYESESEAVHDDSMALPLPPPLDTPIPLKERVLSDESKGAQSIFSGTTVVATNTHPNASSDEPFAHESTVSSEDDDEEASKKSTLQSRRRRSFTFCGIIVALFLSSTAFIFFGTGLHKSLRGAPDVQTQTPGAPAPPTSTPPPAASRLIDILRPASGDFLAYPGSPQFQAFQWMSIEDAIATDPQTSPARIQQRYALVLLYTALSGEIPSFAVNDECEWPTVTCGASGVVSTARAAVDGQVTEIRMARQGFTGNIPSEIKLLQDSLVHLDLAENQYLHGIVPEELYELTNLKSLYLHDNVMRGTISESIKKLQNLEDLYLQNNRFEGSIPYNLGSRQGIRPLRKLIMSKNRFEGTIPTNMSLSYATYVDLSFNNLIGTLPNDFGTNFASLRQLHLTHNRFTGTIPHSYGMAGNGNLVILSLNNNMLTGGIPSTWMAGNVNTIYVQNNHLNQGIDNNLCKMSVANKGGSLIEVGADCSICFCNDFCSHCWGN